MLKIENFVFLGSQVNKYNYIKKEINKRIKLQHVVLWNSEASQIQVSYIFN